MTKLFAIALALILSLTGTAFADGDAASALDAFYALTGKQASADARTAADYLTEILSGTYAAQAEDLTALSAITARDVAAFASQQKVSTRQVRGALYKATAAALQAEIASSATTDEACHCRVS